MAPLSILNLGNEANLGRGGANQCHAVVKIHEVLFSPFAHEEKREKIEEGCKAIERQAECRLKNQ